MGHGFALLKWLDKLVDVGTYTEKEMEDAKKEWRAQEQEDAIEEDRKREEENSS